MFYTYFVLIVKTEKVNLNLYVAGLSLLFFVVCKSIAIVIFCVDFIYFYLCVWICVIGKVNTYLVLEIKPLSLQKEERKA